MRKATVMENAGIKAEREGEESAERKGFDFMDEIEVWIHKECAVRKTATKGDKNFFGRVKKSPYSYEKKRKGKKDIPLNMGSIVRHFLLGGFLLIER